MKTTILVSSLASMALASKQPMLQRHQNSNTAIVLPRAQSYHPGISRHHLNVQKSAVAAHQAKSFFPVEAPLIQDERPSGKGFDFINPKPPARSREKLNAQKLHQAQTLANWMYGALDQERAVVAVVARGGSWQSKTQDKTGMEHSGVAVYLPLKRKWAVFELLNQQRAQPPQQSEIWRSKPVDFFYGHDLNALLLIPDRKTQWKMWAGILTGRYKKLHFTRDYNLVTPPESQRSLNCNKWALMNVLAARLNNYQPTTILEAIHRYLKPGLIRVPPILRPLAKQHPTVMQDEVPVFGPIETVTVESLHQSPLFEKKLYFRKPGCLPLLLDQQA